jgi:hypothetical protein
METWEVDILTKYCQDRGLSVSSFKRKNQLVALAYVQKLPLVVGKLQDKLDATRQYTDVLTLDSGLVISPDPLVLTTGSGPILWELSPSTDESPP